MNGNSAEFMRRAEARARAVREIASNLLLWDGIVEAVDRAQVEKRDAKQAVRELQREAFLGAGKYATGWRVTA